MRFEVGLFVEVEAANKEEAFADVRTNYAVVNDPNGSVSGDVKTVEFIIGDEIHTLEDNEHVID